MFSRIMNEFNESLLKNLDIFRYLLNKTMDLFSIEWLAKMAAIYWTVKIFCKFLHLLSMKSFILGARSWKRTEVHHSYKQQSYTDE